ncbi:MAG: type I pullulanase [Phycisphaerae bacterium]
MRPQMVLATLDAECLIGLRFRRRLPIAECRAERFQLVGDDGRIIGIRSTQARRPLRGKCSRYLLATERPVDFRGCSWMIQSDSFGRAPLRMGKLLQDPALFYDSSTVLGASWMPEATTFRVFAPTAATVRVVVADSPTGDHNRCLHGMKLRPYGIWEVTIPGRLQNKYYAYVLEGPGFDPAREIIDIYATCTQGRNPRSLIVDLLETDPPGFRNHELPALTHPTDAVIYEMHVRDFTIAANSGVRHKGKYLGLTESGTHLPDNPAVCTGLDHLCELGVTHVQLMPVADFDNDETDADPYDWGYMPSHFNSPDGWYATSREGTARIIELKRAIQAFHERGIGVILDVVYNHTSPCASFERLVPDYYYRMTCRGRFSNGSGCGNEFCSESPMARRFLLDSLKYWVSEYRVDGFRFDLMGLIDRKTMLRIKSELEAIRPGILIYGEPWAAGPTPLRPLTDRWRLQNTGIGAFNDCVRNAIKGDANGTEHGFIQTGEHVENLRHALEGSIHVNTVNPAETINYFECHDNLTTWDKLALSVPHETEETRRGMMRLAALILFCSQGIAFMHSGQEFCRTKQGSNNSYNQPDEINRIDWSLKKTYADVWAYHRGMIAIRRRHPVLRLRTRQEIEQRVGFSEPPHPKCVVCHLDGSGLNGESAHEMLILLNGHHEPVTFRLPEGRWSVLADAARADPVSLGAASGCIALPPHSGTLLARPPNPSEIIRMSKPE